jgi:hypothetical protein
VPPLYSLETASESCVGITNAAAKAAKFPADDADFATNDGTLEQRQRFLIGTFLLPTACLMFLFF